MKTQTNPYRHTQVNLQKMKSKEKLKNLFFKSVWGEMIPSVQEENVLKNRFPMRSYEEGREGWREEQREEKRGKKGERKESFFSRP